MSLLTLFQNKCFTYTEKESEGRRVPLSYPIAPRGWAQSRTQPTVYGMGWDAEMQGLDHGMVRDRGEGAGARLVSPSMPLICSSKPA